MVLQSAANPPASSDWFAELDLHPLESIGQSESVISTTGFGHQDHDSTVNWNDSGVIICFNVIFSYSDGGP
jgi:hypothetical protein